MSAEQKAYQIEREHSRYENALENVEALANDGIEQFTAEEKNRLLDEIRTVAADALGGAR